MSDNMEDSIKIETQNLSFIYESRLKNYKESNQNEMPKLNIKEISEKDTEILEKLKVLKKINLTIQTHKFIALLGNTGSGKSSLVRTFNGLIPHFYNGIYFGIVKVLGKDTINEEIKELSMNVGLVFQNPENQLVAMTVEREIAFGLENRGIETSIIRTKIDNVLNILEISHLKYKHPYELSGGEQQRVAIASILVLEPEVIILDEPTATLDQKAARDVLQLLKKINHENGITIIIIEHRLELLLPYCDEIILMDNGKIIEHDKTETILNGTEIYQLEIELPGYINLFHELKTQGLYSGKIPTKINDASNIIGEILRK
jgi:energy-coupling factor transport system ATP-binding protein